MRSRLIRPATAALAAAVLLTLSACSDAAQDDGATTMSDGAAATERPEDSGAGADESSGTSDDQEQVQAEATSAPPVQEGDGEVSTDGAQVDVSQGQVGFLLPSENIACVMSAGSAVCQIDDLTFDPKPEHMLEELLGDCGTASADAMAVVDEERGGWTCLPESISAQAQLERGGYWATEGGETATIDGAEYAVLPYGGSISSGSLTCDSRQDGVECRNTITSHSFQLSSSRYYVT